MGDANPPLVTDVDRVIIRTADIEVSVDVHNSAWTTPERVADGSPTELVIDPEGMPGWMNELLSE